MRMRKSTLAGFLLSAFFFLIVLQSCKDDSYLLAPAPVPNTSFYQDFDTLTNAYNQGWRFINKTTPLGFFQWTTGAIFQMPAYKGVGMLYSFNTVSGLSATGNAVVISNWAVSPPVWLQNGDKIVFYTNSLSLVTRPTRLQVRVNSHNEGLNVGTGGGDVGDFDIPILDINPFQQYGTLESYPTSWTRFEAIVTGLNQPVKGRFALRYYVNGINIANTLAQTIIGIDDLYYISKQN